MSLRSLNYVRSYRLACSLEAQDLAQLIGRDPSVVTRIEKAERAPTARVLMALQVVFGRTPHEVFPSL